MLLRTFAYRLAVTTALFATAFVGAGWKWELGH
jgi:hypothetical protein